MNWESLKNNLLNELTAYIDKRADEADRQSLHNLAQMFYKRFAAQDMRDRSVENLYGCLYGLLGSLRQWRGPAPGIEIFNPEFHAHGWESKYTVVVIVCRGIPFVTASVRGEINRRNLNIHTIASSNLRIQRSEEGELESIMDDTTGPDAEQPGEAVLYFEIGRHSRPEELHELRETLADILTEVELVVDDFVPMCEHLRDVTAMVQASECVEQELRDEATAFLHWLREDHIAMLGYEYLQVDYQGAQPSITVCSEQSLGLLRNRQTRGVLDLQFDLSTVSLAQLSSN